LALVYCFYIWSWAPLAALAPALLLVAFQSLGVGSGTFSWRERLEISKLIGLKRTSVKYKRKSMRLNLAIVFVIGAFALPSCLIWILDGTPPLLLFVAIGFALSNNLAVRFADNQSVWMLLSTTLMVEAMGRPSLLVLIGCWIALNLPPRLLVLPTRSGGKLACDVTSLAPIDVRPALERADRFFACIPPDARVLMTFRDPRGNYGQIFDGFRNAIELLIYVACKRGTILMPQWWTVEEINSPESPGIWIDAPEDIRRQTEFWDCDTILVFRTDAGHLSHDELVKLGLHKIEEISWLALTDLMPQSSDGRDWETLRLELWRVPPSPVPKWV